MFNVSTRTYGVILVVLALCACGSPPVTKKADAVDPQSVTDCDRMAAHPSDPRKVAPGLSTSQIDLPKAVAECKRELALQPDNARISYQLGRVMTYSGNIGDALPHLTMAADADYPQAIFVLGYIHAKGEMVEQDLCKASALYYQAAQMGRQAALVSYPRHVLRGDFSNCAEPKNSAEMLGFLQTARQATSNYYQGLLIQRLMDRLAAS